MGNLVEKTALWIRRVRQAVAALRRPALLLASRQSDFDKAMRHVQHVRSSGPYTREEMNDR